MYNKYIMIENTDKRIPYISLVQFIAIILVIAGHATRIYFYPEGWYFHVPDVYSPILNQFTRFIYTFHMPLFVFLSGYLLENSLRKSPSIRAYIKRRIKRLMLPFFVFGVFYSLPVWRYLNFEGYSLYNFLTGKFMGHLWFLPLLLWLALIYLLLRKIPRKYFLFVLALLSVLYYVVIKGQSYYSILYIPQFLIFYYLGGLYYYFDKHKFFRNIGVIYFIGFINLVIFAILFNQFYLAYYETNVYGLPLALSAIISIIMLSKVYSSKFKDKISNSKIISFVSLNMLYIYVLHEPILELCLKELGWGNMYSPICTSVILFFATTIITILLVIIGQFLIKQVKKRISF